MDDSKNKNPSEVPEEAGTQPTSEEVSATIPDGSETTATAAEAIGEAERDAEVEERKGHDGRRYCTKQRSAGRNGLDSGAILYL